MLKRAVLLISFFIYSFSILAQFPDLIVSRISVKSGNYNIGGSFTFSFRVKNIGTADANTTHARISLYKNPNNFPLTEVQIPALKSNQETSDIYYTCFLPYPTPFQNSTPVGLCYPAVWVNNRNEIGELNTSNNFWDSPNAINISSSLTYQQHLPYPILFVHGLFGDSASWSELIDTLTSKYGLSYGGVMNFCLNQDGDFSTSNAKYDYKDWTIESSLKVSDLYKINFSVDLKGNSLPANNTLESNQSGAVKQGFAIRDAIKHILNVTGKSKVIVVGHSMGGLAIREYLQNPVKWQSDGQHHVAKYLSIGTPHGGSNATSLNILKDFQIIGEDESSEAVRDLRSYYTQTLGLFKNAGVYLFGGNTSPSTFTELPPFYNYDVNSDGIYNENIVGLNQKSLPNNLPFACIIGYDPSAITTCIGCGVYGALDSYTDDGVVETYSANLNNFYPSLNADTFNIVAKAPSLMTPLHNIEQNFYYQILQGLDEPNSLIYPYQISLNNTYWGNFTIQSKTSNYTSYDGDVYSLNIPTSGILNLSLNNISTNAQIQLLNSTGTVLVDSISHFNGSMTLNAPVTTENYKIVILGFPDTLSYLSPYTFKAQLLSKIKPILTPNSIDTLICPNSNFTLNAPTGYLAYLWNTGDTTRTLGIQSPGSYYCQVKDASGYWSLYSDTVTVRFDTIPTFPKISINSTQNSCTSSQTYLLTSTAGYGYQWYKNDTLISNANAQTYNPLVSGIYKVRTYSKNNACSFLSDSVVITNLAANSNRLFNSDTIKICGADSVNLAPITSYNSYLWSTGSTNNTIAAKSTGLYKLTAYCGTNTSNYMFEQLSSSNNATKYITIPDASQLHFTNEMSILLKTRIEGPYSNSTLFEKGSNAYRLTLDANSSSLIFSYSNIDNVVGLKYVLTTSQVQNADWFYVGIVKRVDSSFFYVNGNLVDKAKTVNPIPVNTNNLLFGTGQFPIVGNYNGSMDDISLWNRALTQAEITRYGTCMTGSETGCVGYYNFEGSNATQDHSIYNNTAIQNGSTNNYPNNQIVTCSPTAIKDSVFVSIINPSVSPKTPTICVNTPLQISSKIQTSPVKRIWSTGDTTTNIIVKPKVNTTYSLAISDNYQTCTDSSVVSVNSPLVGINLVGNANICQGDSTILFAPAANSGFQWLNNNIPIAGATNSSLTVRSSGIYRVICFNSTGCSDTSAAISITVNQIQPATITPNSNVSFCQGDSVRLTASQGKFYQWLQNGSSINAYNQTFAANRSGAYAVVIIDSNGCSSTSPSVTVNALPLPTGSIQQPQQHFICDGSSIVLQTGGNYAYQWYNNSSPIQGGTDSLYTAYAGGNYSVKYTSSNGCSSYANNSVNLSVTKKPKADFSVSNYCIGTPITIQNLSDTSNSGNVQWLWQFGDGSSSMLSNPSKTFTNAGLFNIKLSVIPANCPQLADSTIKSITIAQPDSGISYPVIEVKKQLPAYLQARNIGITYQWIPATGLDNSTIASPTAKLDSSQLYNVIITSATGCQVIDTQYVKVISENGVFVPTGFSPDGDGYNDVLRPILVGIKDLHYFKILNRWGQLLYQTSTKGQGWDGTYHGMPQPAETYVWIIEVVDVDGNIIQKTGKSTLIR